MSTNNHKAIAEKYFEAYVAGDTNTILDLVASSAKIQVGLQDWISAPMILPQMLGASSQLKFTLHEIFSNDEGQHFILHFHMVAPDGKKSEHFKVLEVDRNGKIDFIRLVTND